MKRNTSISNALDASKDGIQVQYDQNVKKLLSDKQIFARILKYSLTEFENTSVDDVMNSIQYVTSRPLEPGLTNIGGLYFLQTESSIQNEGVVLLDILAEGDDIYTFRLRSPEEGKKHLDLYELKRRIHYQIYIQAGNRIWQLFRGIDIRSDRNDTDKDTE